MKQNDDKKILSVVVLLLSVVVCVLCGFICYDKLYIEKLPTISEDYESDSNNAVDSDVSVEDTYALGVSENYDGSLEINYFLLNNGKLYYKSLSNINNDYYYTYDFDSSMNNKELIEFTKLTNIKRIKGANTISTGVDFNLILITNDGKVYTYIPSSGMLTLNSFLKDYIIDDISEYNTINGCINDGTENFVTCGGTYKFTTDDGKIHDVKLNTNGTITEN